MRPEDVGHPSGGDAMGPSGCGVRVDAPVAALKQQLTIIRGADTEEESCLASGDVFGRHSRVLECLPCGLEQQALLRIHIDGFASGNAEERGIELVDVAEETSAPRGDSPGRFGVEIIEAIDIPAVARDFGDRVSRLRQQLPESVGTMHSSGKAAPNSYDGHRFLLRALELLQSLLLVKRQQYQVLGRQVFNALQKILHDVCSAAWFSNCSTSPSDSRSSLLKKSPISVPADSGASVCESGSIWLARYSAMAAVDG
jgi:hypothetical protein